MRCELCRNELDELMGKVEVERNRFQKTSQNEDAVSAMPLFSVNHKFFLNQEDSSYTLSLEAQSPIDFVLLQVNYRA